MILKIYGVMQNLLNINRYKFEMLNDVEITHLLKKYEQRKFKR